jgi:hypothetical protein
MSAWLTSLVDAAAIGIPSYSFDVVTVPAPQEINSLNARHIFKRQRETGPNEGALYCKKAPCADGRLDSMLLVEYAFADYIYLTQLLWT